MSNTKDLIKLFKECGIKIQNKSLENRSSTTPAKKMINFDINNIINIAHFIRKIEKKANFFPSKVVKYLEADYLLRISSWFLIRKIEEKLTSAFQQKIAFNEKYGEDFHLKDINFQLTKKIGSKNQKSIYRDELKQFINWIKSKKQNSENKNLPFSIFISEISLTQKIKFLKFIKEEIRELIFEKFGSKNQKDFLWIFSQLINFRNSAAHHDVIISKEFIINNNKKVGINEFLPYLYKLASKIETKKFKSFLSIDKASCQIFEKMKIVI